MKKEKTKIRRPHLRPYFIRRIGSDKTGHWEVIKGKEDKV